VLHTATDIGTTKNPCGAVGVYLADFPGQAGPLNGPSAPLLQANRISLVNDGSPDPGAVEAFNTLMGKDVDPAIPKFWENIGSRITFTAGSAASERVYQPYPTYEVFVNGRYSQTFFQAADPIEQFQTNPYPFGTVPCPGIFGTTPGGRCGDGHSAPDPTVRQPPPPFTIL
jgi:hypothetical protein